MAARLPQPGQDDGKWGDILNDFLSQAHNDDGTLKPLTTSQITGLTALLSDKVNITDGRLSDTRTPSDASVTNAKVGASAAISADKLADGTSNKIMTAAERTLLTAATSTRNGDTLAKRDAGGSAEFKEIYLLQQSDVSSATRKDYVDSQIVQKAQRYDFNPGVSANQRRYIRLLTIDGVSVDLGANVSFILSGTGDYGTLNRGTVLVHVGQRASGGISLRSWGWDVANSSDPVELYTRQLSTFAFEIWAKLSDYNLNQTLQVLSASSGVTINVDSASITTPTGISAPATIVNMNPDSAATASTVAYRNTSGDSSFREVLLTQQTTAGSAARKDYVDTNGAASPADATTTTGTIDLSVAAFAPPKVRVLTLSGNVTVTNNPASIGATRAGVTVVTFKQAATGGPFTVTWPTMVWAGGVAAPTMPTVANAELEVHLFWNGAAWRAKVGGTYFP